MCSFLFVNIVVTLLTMYKVVEVIGLGRSELKLSLLFAYYWLITVWLEHKKVTLFITILIRENSLTCAPWSAIYTTLGNISVWLVFTFVIEWK